MRGTGGTRRPGGIRRPGGTGRPGGTRRPADARAGKPEATQVAERLQKVLARAGLASRREAETWIRAGRLTVNGAVASLGARVAPGDDLRLDGRAVRMRTPLEEHAFLCHRSPGEPLIEPPGAQPVPVEPPRAAMTARLPRRLGRRFIPISPMPRGDGGLELLASGGELAARLQRSVRALSAEFGVRVLGPLGEAQMQGILAGQLDSGTRLTVERCEPGGGEGANRWYQLLVRGASGREVRQLLERVGAQVSRVLRTRLGPLALERSLGRGRFRELTQEELRALLSAGDERAGG
jgi:23S rRNA pseudouridine2605 synthase